MVTRLPGDQYTCVPRVPQRRAHHDERGADKGADELGAEQAIALAWSLIQFGEGGVADDARHNGPHCTGPGPLGLRRRLLDLLCPHLNLAIALKRRVRCQFARKRSLWMANTLRCFKGVWMSRIKMNTTVQDLLTFYKTEQRIFGRCPHCQDVFRLSEAKLTYGKEPPRDMLSRLKKERNQLEQRVSELDAQIAEMEQTHIMKVETIEDEHVREIDDVHAKWRDRVDLEVQRHLENKKKEIREHAIAGSRATTLGKTIERIAPMFSGFGHHPADARPIFEPLDFVIFDGLYTGEVTEVVFLEFKTGNAALSRAQRTIREAVNKKRVRFEERRMTSEMLHRLSLGKRPPVGVAPIVLKPPR